MSTRTSVMCTLCGVAGTVETDFDKPEAVASATAWSLHFVSNHPGVEGAVSRYLVMTESAEQGRSAADA